MNTVVEQCIFCGANAQQAGCLCSPTVARTAAGSPSPAQHTTAYGRLSSRHTRSCSSV